METFNDYRLQASRTYNNDLDPQLQLDVYAMGLAGESGEVIDLLKKHLGHAHPLDLIALKKELGDTLWYVAAIATTLKLNIQFYLDTQGVYAIYSKAPSRECIKLDHLVGQVSANILDLEIFPTQATENIRSALITILNSINSLCYHYSLTLVDVAQTNIEKLLKLYPDGFDPERSRNRND
jgi:NTP pyrophosphatase (non-canonical NTP hydrolase)